jgi:hypothetical protein
MMEMSLRRQIKGNLQRSRPGDRPFNVVLDHLANFGALLLTQHDPSLETQFET